MLLRSEIPAELKWDIAFSYQSIVKKGRIGAPVSMFIEECAPHKLNWALVYLWCNLRTDWFKGVGIDWNFGKFDNSKYRTSREGVRAAVEHIATKTTVEELELANELATEYDALVKYAKGENPQAKDPVIDPPSFPQKPMPPKHDFPVPVPSKPGEPSKSSWPSAKRILGVCGALVTLLSICSAFIPALAPIAAVLKTVIEALKAIFIGG